MPEDIKPEASLVRLRKTAEQLVRPVSFEPPAAEPPPAAPKEGGVNYLSVLWRRKFLILAGLTAGLLGGLAWAIFHVPMYHASSTVELVAMNESFMQMNQFDPQAGTFAYGGNAVAIATQLRVILSPSQVNRVADRMTLELTPITPPQVDIFSKIRTRLRLLPQEPVEFMRLAINTATRSATAHLVGSTRLIEITSDSVSPDVAAAVVNALAAEYIARLQEFRSSSATKTTQWLETQIEESKSRVEQADLKFQEFVQKQGQAFVLDQNTLADSKLRQLQADLSTSQTERINKQSRYELAKSNPVDSLGEILDDGTLRVLRDRLTDLRKDRAHLTATLTPENYKVQRIDAQIAELEATLQREKGNMVKRIQNEYEAAVRREKLLSGAYSAQSQSLANQADKAAQYSLLKREVEMAQQAYKALLEQYNHAAMLTQVPANNVRVLDMAVPPTLISSPIPRLDVPIGGLVGALLAIVLSVLQEMLRLKKMSRVFAAPGHIGSVLNVPELGVIPAFDAPGMRAGKLRRASNGDSLFKDPGAEPAPHLIASKSGSFAESFRYALTSLLARQTENARLMLTVTSPGPGEGKTTLISNLALATAETGRRVLLIDADLRRARLHKIFHLEPGLGFSDLLKSDVPISKIDLGRYIQPTGTPGLSLLTSGSAEVDSVGPLLFSQNLPELLARVRENFDVVLIDTAPALQFSDARLLGLLGDGVILIVRAGVTFRESALATAQRLYEDGIPILGTILNDWNPKKSNQAYYSSSSQFRDHYQDQGSAD